MNRNGNGAFPSSPPLVTKLVADAGYVCGNVGRLHLASAWNGSEARTDDGYSYFAYSHKPSQHGGYDYAAWIKSRGGLLDALTSSAGGVPSRLHQTTWCVGRAIEFIDRNRDRPWMLTVNPFDPHPPFDPPADYVDMFDADAMPRPHIRETDLDAQAKLARSISGRRPGGRTAAAMRSDCTKTEAAAGYLLRHDSVDRRPDRLLGHLKAASLAKTTLVIFTSDHGLLLKGCHFYEGLARVTLVLCGPGVVSAGHRSDAHVKLTDLAPTILEHCGVKITSAKHGRSLAPIMRGDTDPSVHRDHVRCEYFDAVDMPDKTSATMFRNARYKLVVYHNHDLGELFDLSRDPWEFHNLWDSADHHSIKSDLIRRSFNSTVAAFDKGPDRIAPW